MPNPSNIKQPELTNPLKKKEKTKGNFPYLNHRRKLRKEMWK